MSQTKVLIVEDEGIVALDLRRMLLQAGYSVTGTAATGAEALKLATQNPPDVVLMDIALRGELDGIEAAQRIRAQQDVPIIYVTANSDPATLQRAKLTDPFGYIVKPFEERDVRVRLEMALYKYQTEKALRENRAWLNATLRSIGDAVIATDAQGRIKFMNPVAEQLTGWRETEATGQPLLAVFNIVNEQTRALVENPVDKVLREKQIVGLANHTVLIAKDGQEWHIDDAAAPILNDKDEINGVVLTFRDVSEKRKDAIALEKSQAQLAASREALNQMIQQAPLGIQVFDINGLCMDVNQAYLDLFDIPERTLFVGRYNICTDATAQRIGTCAAAMRALTGEVVALGDLTFDSSPHMESRQGEMQRTVNVTFFPVFDEYRQVMHIVGLHQDITARKQAEETYRVLVENSLQGLMIFQDGRTVFANAVTAEITGYTITELLALSPEQQRALIHPDDQALVAQRIRARLNGNPISPRHEFRLVRKDGTVRWVDNHATRIIYRGRPAVQTVYMDITERKLAEQALAAEKERLLVTLRSIGDGVIATDVQGRITLMNPIAEQLTGWTTDDVAGKSLSEVFHIINEETRERSESPVETVLQTGSIVGLANHTLLVTKDGRELSIADSGAPIRNQDGHTVGVVLVFRDVTERQKIQATLQNAAKLEAVGVLAGGLAHDFNNLLGGLFGHIYLAREMLAQPETASEHLSQALDVFNRAKGLTQQLLTFAKGGSPVKKLTTLAKLLRDTAQFVLSGSNVRAAINLPNNLWPCEVDENQIGQVFDNLIINAMQAMPTGGQVTIDVENVHRSGVIPALLPKSHYVKVVIRDHGIGISKEHLSKIFEPFFTTKQKGSGLGLATVWAIVKKHNGYIDVASELGQGTTFSVYLPASPRALLTPLETTPTATKGQGHILVMDDEDAIKAVLGKLLTRQGYMVGFASHGAEAVKVFKQAYTSEKPFDAVILDLTIPGGAGGQEIIKDLLAIDPFVKAIASSGYSDDLVMAHPHDYGFKGVIAKPYTPSELGTVLRKILQGE
jgi:PAS domain S-box-containing protein